MKKDINMVLEILEAGKQNKPLKPTPKREKPSKIAYIPTREELESEKNKSEFIALMILMQTNPSKATEIIEKQIGIDKFRD